LTISTQRCTFLTWDHRSGEYYHNFITWKDLRADELVEQWNNSWTKSSMNWFSYALFLLTRQSRFLAGSVLKLMNGQVTPRLLFEIMHNKKLKQALMQKKARVELLDSWILHKLRTGSSRDKDVEHITDVTSSTATGLYDPFTLSWSPLISFLFGINVSGLASLKDDIFIYLCFNYSRKSCPVLWTMPTRVSAMCILRLWVPIGPTQMFPLPPL